MVKIDNTYEHNTIKIGENQISATDQFKISVRCPLPDVPLNKMNFFHTDPADGVHAGGVESFCTPGGGLYGSRATCIAFWGVPTAEKRQISGPLCQP